LSNIHSYPKIFAVGSDWIPNLFTGPVEVTEKIDGSMFAFGVTAEGALVMRSKGKEMFFESCEKMFTKAADYVSSIQETLLRMALNFHGLYFYGEFLGGPSHNVLKYGRVPKNHIMLFGVRVGEAWVRDHAELADWAARLGLEAVPLLHSGELKDIAELNAFFERESVLGNENLEGVVVKNYAQQTIIGQQVFPSFGKYVRAEFKERHATEWGPKFSQGSQLDRWLETFRAEARWQKAVQHLREAGLLANEPRDIGILLKELERDLFDEERPNIEKELFRLFKDQIARKARAGFPEWYKEQLAQRAFASTSTT
jgi:hypothetical protein